MVLYYNRFLRKLGLTKTSVWGVAIRKSENPSILLNKEKTRGRFTIVENTSEYWFADPILFTADNKTYLFVEAFSYDRHKGELGVFDIVNGEAINFRKIIETPTHMSYPFVFKYQDEYYMIPETGAAKEIVLYKATSFPNNWAREKVLVSGAVYRDNTIFLDDNGQLKMISYKQEGNNRFNLKYFVDLFELNMDKKELKLISEECDNDRINRPAGPIMKFGNHILRLSQRCNRAYGESIYVYDMKDGVKIQKSYILNELRGQNIELSNRKKAILLHTYSQSGEYEVIDFRFEL